MSTRAEVAGIYRALGDRHRARTIQVAGRMARGTRYATVAWPMPARHLNGRPVRRRRAAERTGRDWRTQPRDSGGRWVAAA